MPSLQVRDISPVILGKRLANIYDLSDKMYLLKFSVPGTSEKPLLVLESGIRFHLTKYVRTTPDLPSPFSMKLRKYIRTKLLEGVSQIGFDRVVDFKFGSGENVNHLILELYAGGNLVLTDANYEVIGLLRSHQFADDVVLKVGEIYPVAYTTNLTAQISTGVVGTNLQNIVNFKVWLNELATHHVETNEKEDSAKHKSKSKGLVLRQILLNKDSGVSHLGPEIIEHCILQSGLKMNLKLDQVSNANEDNLLVLLKSLDSAIEILCSLESSHEGYIIMEKNNTEMYREFTPILLNQHQDCVSKSFVDFSSAVDGYFYKLEDQKMMKEIQSREDAARKKLAKVQEEQEKLVQSLAEQKHNLEISAMLLELHADEVDKVCLVLNSAIQAELTWSQIEDMVEKDKLRGNPFFSPWAVMFLN
jgi:predicted ribosome quality control (RQC) complex YloA/Tae2 family protein